MVIAGACRAAVYRNTTCRTAARDAYWAAAATAATACWVSGVAFAIGRTFAVPSPPGASPIPPHVVRELGACEEVRMPGRTRGKSKAICGERVCSRVKRSRLSAITLGAFC